jgi:hypothetical protein
MPASLHGMENQSFLNVVGALQSGEVFESAWWFEIETYPKVLLLLVSGLPVKDAPGDEVTGRPGSLRE